MANSNGVTAAVLPKGTEYGVPVSSGHTLTIRQPSVGMIMAINERARKEHPDPPMPIEVVTVAGREEEIPAAPGTPAYEEWTKARQEAIRAREEYLLEFLFTRRISVEGYEGEEGESKLVAEYTDELTELREWGDVDEDLSDFQVILRNLIVFSPEDYATVVHIAGLLVNTTDVKPEAVRARAESFRRDVARAANP